MLRICAEGNVGCGVDHGRDLGKPVRDDVRQILVPVDPGHGNEIPFSGYGINLADPLDRGDFLGSFRDAGSVGLDQDKCSDHVEPFRICCAVAVPGKLLLPAYYIGSRARPDRRVPSCSGTAAAPEPRQQQAVAKQQDPQADQSHYDKREHHGLAGQGAQHHPSRHAAEPNGEAGAP